MQFKIIYSQIQIECAVEFIINNNVVFKNRANKVRNEILRSIDDIVKSQKTNNPLYDIRTMGFMVVADVELESVDNDENFININIMVDPALLIKETKDYDVNVKTMEI